MMPGRVACPTHRPPFPLTTIMRPRSWALGRRRMLKFWHAAVQVAVLASAFSCTQDLVSTKQTWHASRQRGTDRPLDFGRLLPSSRRRLDQQPAISDFSLRNATSGHIRTRTTKSDRCYEQGRGVSLPLGIAAEAQALHLSIVRRSAYRAAEASPPAPPALGSLGNICQAFFPQSPGGESAAHGLHERGARSSGASGQDTGARAGESGQGRRRCAHADTATGGRCRGPVGGFLGYSKAEMA